MERHVIFIEAHGVFTTDGMRNIDICKKDYDILRTLQIYHSKNIHFILLYDMTSKYNIKVPSPDTFYHHMYELNDTTYASYPPKIEQMCKYLEKHNYIPTETKVSILWNSADLVYTHRKFEIDECPLFTQWQKKIKVYRTNNSSFNDITGIFDVTDLSTDGGKGAIDEFVYRFVL